MIVRSLFSRSSRSAALLALALLAAPAAAPAQDRAAGGDGTGTPAIGPARASSTSPDVRALRDLAAPRVLHDARPAAATGPSLSRHLLVGSGVGAAVGTAFALAVFSLADCGGPDCSGERVIGVTGHALAGAALGALVGGVTYLVRR